MSATEPTHPTAAYSAVSLTRLHDAAYWEDPAHEWLPRKAELELQIGPSLGFSRVWREVVLDLQSGPEYLYRYFPFTCYVYVEGRAHSAVEFDAPMQAQQAVLRVPVGVPVKISIVSELAGVPAATGHGADSRELALRFPGLSLGEGFIAAPPPSRRVLHEHHDLDVRQSNEQAPEPVFVVGAYRSGTSVLTWALGQHPNVWPLEETGWIPPLADAAILGYRNAKTAARGFFDVYDVNRREYCEQLGAMIDRFCRGVSRRHLHEILLARLSGRAENYNPEFQLARSIMNPKRRWVDGTPENSGYITALLALFPHAQFVGLVRNPLDVVASMLRFDRAGGEARSVKDAAEMWLSMMRRLLLSYRAFGPATVRLISYEKLVDDPRGTLRDVFDFLGEPDFGHAAGTYAMRINSSQISAEERKALYEEIDGDAETKERLLALAREIAEAIEAPWQYDGNAHAELKRIESNRIGRMALEYRGGIPLPTDE